MDALTEATAARAELHKSTYWPAAQKQKGSNHLWLTDVHLAAVIAALPGAPAPETRSIGIATGAGPGTPTSLSGVALDSYIASMKTVKANAVRIDCRGLTSQFDATVKAALLASLNVLILFPDDPTLAGPCAQKYVPLGVLDYETGNEPNIRGTTPAQWLAWNNSVYTSVKAVSKDTKVISAGLAPHGAYGAVDGIRINPVTYLEKTLIAGKMLCDALGWHPYNYWASPPACTAVAMLEDQPWSAWTQMAKTPVSALSLIRKYGLVEKIAVTEFGVPTYAGAVTPDVQEGFIKLALADLKARPYIDDIYLYSLRNRPDLTPDQAYFGIEGKPGAAAFAAAV